jgi:phospholipid-binding lipoprotein MlaA
MRLNSSLLRLLRAGALALVAVWLAGCASLVGDPRHPVDPFEPMNRKVMSFNDDLDKAVIKPVALAYRDRVPRPVRVGVSNVLGNIADVWSFFNSTLQLKMHQAAELGGRVAINSVFGLGGLIDVASEFGLEHRAEDFGQTLGRWGVPSGPYLVLPVLGPSSVRDAAATLTLDRYLDPLTHFDHERVRWVMYGLRAVDTRTNLLKVTNVVDEIALDRYTFIRDAYLQRRFAEVGRGRPAPAPPDPNEVWDGRDDTPAPVVSPTSPATPTSPTSPTGPALPSPGLLAPEHNPKP